MVKHLWVWFLACVVACQEDKPHDTAPGDCTPVSWYLDADSDGYGSAGELVEACEPPPGHVLDHTDCDDSDPAVSPEGAEVCNGVDDDCDAIVDNVAGGSFAVYADDDGDGYGDPATASEAVCLPDGAVTDGGDCDDGDPAVSPAEDEVCDGVDNDCDGNVDGDAVDRSVWYTDLDGDGFGGSPSVLACDQPSGFVDNVSDCDDTDAAISPAAEEVCNRTDDDCDGIADEDDAADVRVWHEDADGDGYGVSGGTVSACERPTGYADNTDDCDDSSASVSPGEPEACDGVDNDCDGAIDEDVTTIFYGDGDGDGYGDIDSTAEACSAPSGYVTDGTDCDDTDASRSPGEAEVCDEIDNNCDGAIDEGVTPRWHVDSDGDGYGDAASAVEACSAPSGYITDGTDCDDADASRSPGTAETCDEVDNDCDGRIDEGVTPRWYVDVDGDGYGDAASAVEACSAPSGYVSDSTDCDDADATVYPGAGEACACEDGADNDSDGLLDCEDGDCLTDPACYELDCEDGSDGDNDGATDCWDEDCWGEEACESTYLSEATVHSGSLSGTRFSYWRIRPYGSGSPSVRRTYIQSSTLVASDVYGTAVLSLPGRSSVVCGWTVDRASWWGRARARYVSTVSWTQHYTFSSSPVTRSGWALSSGCSVETSSAAVLPPHLGVRAHFKMGGLLGEIGYGRSCERWYTPASSSWTRTASTSWVSPRGFATTYINSSTLTGSLTTGDAFANGNACSPQGFSGAW